MPLRTKQEYFQSLNDGRYIFFKGQKVENVATHPQLGRVARHLSLEFEIPEIERYRELATFDPQDDSRKTKGERYSRYFKIPRSSDDLLLRSQLIDLGTRLSSTVVLLIKEIGTDCLFALNLLSKSIDQKLSTKYAERVSKFHAYCMTNDLAMAVAQTDVKGDRSLGPFDQPDPDYYLHVVDQNSDGIIVRGAKAHTTYAPFVNEILVIPTRNMTEQDRDYAVSFAVPANTKGLKMIASPFGGEGESEFHNPISSRHHMMESVTIFDDVFVPWERVFLCKEWQHAGPLALGFVDFHRFTAISYKAPLLDLFVGAALLMAQYNGISDASHVRDKIARLMSYAETVKGLTKTAAYTCNVVNGVAVPNPIYSNTAKYHFAVNYHQALAILQDIAGGLVVTGPHEKDLFENKSTSGLLMKYLGGKKGTTTLERLKMLNLIRDLTASDFAGYYQLLQIHAEGSIEAEKLMVYRSFEKEKAVQYAKSILEKDESSS